MSLSPLVGTTVAMVRSCWHCVPWLGYSTTHSFRQSMSARLKSPISKPEMDTILSWYFWTGTSEAVPDSQVSAYQEACRMTLCISSLNIDSSLWPKPIHSLPPLLVLLVPDVYFYWRQVRIVHLLFHRSCHSCRKYELRHEISNNLTF